MAGVGGGGIVVGWPMLDPGGGGGIIGADPGKKNQSDRVNITSLIEPTLKVFLNPQR